MITELKFAFFLNAAFLFAACDTTTQKEKCVKHDKPHKRVGNILFLIPANGYAHHNQDKLIDECIAAMQANSSLINLASFNDSITIISTYRPVVTTQLQSLVCSGKICL